MRQENLDSFGIACRNRDAHISLTNPARKAPAVFCAILIRGCPIPQSRFAAAAREATHSARSESASASIIPVELRSGQNYSLSRSTWSPCGQIEAPMEERRHGEQVQSVLLGHVP